VGLKQVKYPPRSRAAAVFIKAFHRHMAGMLKRRGPDDFAQEGFGGLIPMQHTILAAFLDVEDKLQGNAGLAGPVGMGWLAFIASEVAGVVCAHGFARVVGVGLVLGEREGKASGKLGLAPQRGVLTKRKLVKQGILARMN